MPKLTQEQAIIAALLARGEVEEKTRVTRYRTFSRKYLGQRDAHGNLWPVFHGGQFWFVAKGGGLRFGRRHSDSISSSKVGKTQLLIEGGYCKC